MTIEDIIDAANELADEDIDFDEMLKFFNRAISKINLTTGMVFPIAVQGNDTISGNIEDEYYVMKKVTVVDDTNTTELEKIRIGQFASANQMFLDMIVIQYIHYCVKVQDATEYEWRASYQEWEANMKEFIARWKPMINEYYLSQNIDLDGSGATQENGFGIYVVEDSPYSDMQTWGTRPTPGNGNVASSSFKGKSTDPYGLKG